MSAKRCMRNGQAILIILITVIETSDRLRD